MHLTRCNITTNSNLNKMTSTLGSINTSLDKQKSVSDDISDALVVRDMNNQKLLFQERVMGVILVELILVVLSEINRMNKRKMNMI